MHTASTGNFFNCIIWYIYEVEVTNSLAEQIKTLRKKRRWTQIELADWLGIQQSTVSRWERGTTRPTGVYLTLLKPLLAGRRVRK